MTGYEQYSGIPVVGSISIESGSKAVHISDTYKTDRRDDESFYVAAHAEIETSVVFLFIVIPEKGGMLIEAVDNRARGGKGKTDGKYLAVHNARDDDSLYSGYTRVIVHSDKEKAAIWCVADVGGQKYLQVKSNMEESGTDSVGCYLAVPPDSERDSNSNFVAVTPDVGQATPISAFSV